MTGLYQLQVGDGAVHQYRFNETSGTVAADLGSSPSAGTYNSCALNQAPITGDNGGCVQLNGTSSEVSFPYVDPPAGGNGAWTVEMVFQPISGISGTSRLIANAHTDGGGNHGFQVAGSSGLAFAADVGFSGGTSSVTPGVSFAAGTTYLIDLIYSGTVSNTLTMYVNGVQTGTIPTTSGTYGAGTNDMAVGFNPSYSGDYSKAYISDLALYAAALTPTQITNHYAALSNPATTTSTFSVLGQALLAGVGQRQIVSSFAILGQALLAGKSPGPFIPSTCQVPPLQVNQTSLATILASYLYKQYTDDDNLQGFVDAYNQMAQAYQDWFNATPLGVYTSPGVTGPLLDWIGQGVYGIRRPVVGTFNESERGALATFFFGQLPMGAQRVTRSGSASPVNDDVYKRVLTWWLYRGDGKQMSVDWIKRRVSRFMYGVNGTDFPYPPCAPNPLFSVEYERAKGYIGAIGTFSMASIGMGRTKMKPGLLTSFTISVPGSVPGAALQLLVAAGALALPFENNFVVELT